MSKICPKCSYVRLATDQAPDWQCPACGVAYHKVGLQAGADLQRYQQRRQSQEQGNKSNWLWVLAIIIITAICLQSYLSYKKKRMTARASETISYAAPAEGKKASNRQPKVILYGTEWCGYCAASRDYFKAHGIAYDEFDIEKDHQAYLEFQRLGGQGVPLLKIGDDIIKGYNEDRMHNLLANFHRQ